MSRYSLLLHSTVAYVKWFVHFVEQEFVINNHAGRDTGRGGDIFVQVRDRRIWQLNYETNDAIGVGSPSEAEKLSQKYSLPCSSLA